MKPMGDGTMLGAGCVDAATCLRYALSLPTDVVITGCESMERLEQAVRVASDFKPMTAEERTEVERRVRAAGDATARSSATRPRTRTTGPRRIPEWLGDIEYWRRTASAPPPHSGG